MSFFNNTLNSNHPLINREQNYVAERKILTVHSEDRDIKIWPYTDEFEIICPQTYANVQSVSLSQINLPHIFYNFSDDFENTIMTYNSNKLTLPPGSYTYNILAQVLENKMNTIKVRYSSLQHKYLFLSDSSFNFDFSAVEVYDNSCPNKNVSFSKINWGLSYFLGFSKKIYNSDISSQDILNDYNISDISAHVYPHYIVSEFPIPSAFNKHTIYMELEKMNNIDELKPYINNTTSAYNNDYNGFVNNSFAKIICQNRNATNSTNNAIDWETIYDNKNNKAIITFDPPLERLNKLKVKFRYHDGVNVDFLNNEINFSLEIVQLKNEISRSYAVRLPVAYTF